MNAKRVTIMGIPFDTVEADEALEKILNKLHEKKTKSFFVATPNPEMLLESRKNSLFKAVLLSTDLNIPDGIGIIFASRFQKTPLKKRVTGTDLMQKICMRLDEKTKIFLLGAAPGVAEKAKEALELKNPHLTIVGTHSGTPNPFDEMHIRQLINRSGAELLFVAFGAPKQELWLDRNLTRLEQIKVAMGVGGAFDFIAGTRKRAPAWMRKLGLEWLFRLIQEPRRIKRIWNATVKFPLIFFVDSFRKK